MENHEGMATGIINGCAYKGRLKDLWEDLTKLLNSEGEPTRDVEGWKKVQLTII